MFNFSKKFNNMNTENKIISNFNKNSDGGIRNIKQVKEDVNNAKFRAEQIKREAFNKSQFENKNTNSLGKDASSFKTKIDSLNNLKKRNF